MKPTKIQYSKYQSLYDYFNRSLFDNKLGNCILNFSRRGSNNGGHFSPDRWKSKEGVTHEINLNPKGIAARKFSNIDICAVLVHEMCHLWQEEQGKPGKSGYHNKEWSRKMQEVGLMPSNTGKPEGKKTGRRMSHYIINGGNFQKAFDKLPKDLNLPFKSIEGLGRHKKKTKYTCRNCGSSVWGKSGLEVACFSCIPVETKKGATEVFNKILMVN